MDWKPIETAPRDDVYVLTWDGIAYNVAAFALDEGGRLAFQADGAPFHYPTHWRPLPSPPGENTVLFTVRHKNCAGCGQRETRVWQFKAVTGGRPGVWCGACVLEEMHRVTLDRAEWNQGK